MSALLSRAILGCGLVLAATGPAAAIIRRDDQADARYIAAAAAAPRPVVLLRAPKGASDGMGTFIAPGWIVTAAHVAEGLREGAALPDDPALAIRRIVLHPDWRGNENDIALVRVEGGASYPLIKPCNGEDGPGAAIVLVGAGDHGDGLTGPVGHDRSLRAAHNVVDAADETSLRFDFDAPATAVELEGVGGPGDSGGPAFVMGQGEACLAGVSSGQISEPGRRGRYGAIEVYTRLAGYRAWIEAVIGG